MGTVSPLRRFADGLANVLTGRGTTVDRSAHNFWMRRFTTPEQIESAYLGSWLHRKIVDIPAQDMTRAGRDWDATDDQISAIEKEEKRLGYWPKLYEALTLGRLGGGAILIGLGDDPTKPLPTTIRRGQIRYLSVLSRWQLTLGEMETDPESDNFGQPRYFRLSGTGRQVDIHPSRVAVFKGLPIPAIRMTSWEDNFWGMSVVEACDEAVQQATTACAGFSALIDEAKIDVFRFFGLAEKLTQPEGEENIVKRVELTNTGKSVHRAVILDKEDEWEQRQLSLAGVRDVIITYDGRCAGAADMPAVRLFGKSPDGMNATGESDLANYFQGVGAKQDMQLRPPMQQIDAVMLPSAGVPADLPWTFSTLMVLTEQQAAEIELKEAQALEKIVGLALVPETAMAKTVQNRLVESGRWPGLKVEIEKAEAAGEELPEGDETELGIVPVGSEGGDLASARNGGLGSRAASGAVNDAATWLSDATPRPLYVQRKLLNAADLIAWAKDNGFATTLPASDLHVTILYSRSPVDPMKMGRDWREDEKGQIIVRPGGPRVIEKLGENAVVLRFACPDLDWRHKDMIEAGGSHDWPEYAPHVTISYTAPEGADIDALKPFNGALRFGPEEFEALDLDWKSKVSEQ
jgi:phage-related protein (TIGR01555 family)